MSVAFKNPKTGRVSHLTPGSSRYQKAMKEGWKQLDKAGIREIRAVKRAELGLVKEPKVIVRPAAVRAVTRPTIEREAVTLSLQEARKTYQDKYGTLIGFDYREMQAGEIQAPTKAIRKAKKYIKEAEDTLSTVRDQIETLSEDPSAYQITDPDTGKTRVVTKSDIRKLEGKATDIEQYIIETKGIEARATAEVKRIKTAPKVTVWRVEGVEGTFKTEAAAKAAGKAAVEERARTFVGPPAGAVADPRLTALGDLSRAGIVEEPEHGKFTLTVSPEGMTSEQIKLANTAGFVLEDLPSGPSWKLYQWGEKTLKEGSPAQGQVQYWASMLGQFEKSATGLYRGIASVIPGEQPGEKGWKKITPEIAEKIEHLTPIEKGAYTLGGLGAAGLGAYVQMVPVGVAAAGVTTIASNIASGLGVTAPAAVAKIGETLATHPRLVQAALFAPVAGMEAKTVYTRHEKGDDLDDIVADVLMDAAEIVGGVAGLKAGMELPSNIRSWWTTRGMEKIPSEELWRRYTMESHQLPTYDTTSSATRLKEYKDLSKILGGEEYLGKISPEQYRSWHGTPKQWAYEVGEETIAGAGKNIKLPGMFYAPEPSPLRVGWGVGEKARLGLPTIGGTPELITVDSLVAQMPPGLTKVQLTKWLADRIGSGTLYVPNAPFITAEMEAYLPAGSKMVKTGADFYTVFGGQKIPISQYRIVTAAQEAALIDAGYTVESVSGVVSSLSEMPSVQTVFPVTALPTSMSIGLGDTLSISADSITESELTKLNNVFGTELNIESFTEYPDKSIGDIFSGEVSRLGIDTPITSVMDILNKPVTELTSSELSKLNESLDSSFTRSDLSDLEDMTVEDTIALITTTSDVGEGITLPTPSISTAEPEPLEITVDIDEEPPPSPPPPVPVPPIPTPPPPTPPSPPTSLRPRNIRELLATPVGRKRLMRMSMKPTQRERIKAPRSRVPEPYRVKFQYPTGASETKRVGATSFGEAYTLAKRLTKIKGVPIEVEVEHIPEITGTPSEAK